MAAGQYDLPKSPKTDPVDPRGMAAHIRATAVKYGIDPEVALRVAKSEGLSTFQSSVPRTGKGSYNGREDSWGAFQLYKGGGLGNEFQKATGLDPSDPANEKATIDYALKHASQNGWGSWYGAKNTGIGNREGIGAGPGGAGPTTDFYSGNPVPADTSAPAAPAVAAAAPEKSKDYGAIVGDTLQQMGVDMLKGANAQTAARSTPAAVTPQAPLPQAPVPTVDPRMAEMQRQKLAMTMQRLNSGRLA